MAIETERKFLINPSKLPNLIKGTRIMQGYIPTLGKTVVRPRIKGEKAYITIKGESNGVSCSEFEYEIPVKDAEEMISELCKGKMVEKTRYEINVGSHLWELDVFHGQNTGLILAEIELSDESEQFEMPSWVAKQVTGDQRYYNSELLNTPYSNWPKT